MGTNNFASKHPKGTQPDPKIVKALQDKAKQGKVSCAGAHKIAKDLNTAPSEVGMNMDLTPPGAGLRIHKCQLGLFGYYPEKCIVKPAENISEELENAIQKNLINNRLPCLSAWNIAEKLNCSRMDVASACEKLQIKISSCQLGAF